MKKQFVTFPIAVALKELGFNEKCLTSFDRDGSLFSIFDQSTDYSFVTYIDDTPDRHYCISDEILDEYTLAPLWQQVVDWLFQKHGLFVHPMWMSKDAPFCYKISTVTDPCCAYSPINFNNPQEAREAAILQAIEIIKNQII